MPEDKLYRIMRKVAEAEHSKPIDESVDHPVDDVNMMEAWTLGTLPEKKCDALLKHLADCVYCRRETAAMIRDGVLNFEETENSETIKPMTSRPLAHRIFRILMTVAAVLLVGFGVWILQPTPQEQIAKATPVFKIVAAKPYRSIATRGAEESTQDDKQKEKERIAAILEKAGSDPEKRFDAGLELLIMQTEESVEQAIGVFEQLNKEHPDNAAILNALGIAYNSNGEPEKAIESYEKAKQIDPANTQIRENMDRML